MAISFRSFRQRPSSASRQPAERRGGQSNITSRFGSNRPGASRSGANRSGASRFGSSRAGANRSGAIRSEANRPGSNRAETNGIKATRRSLADRVSQLVLGGLEPSPRRTRASIAVPRSRLLVVWLLLMAGMVGLMINLMRIQIFQGDLLQARARAQQTISINAVIPRRPIIDREGNVLAIDKPTYTLYAHPVLFQQQKETVAVSLAPILNKSLEQTLQLLSQGNTGIRLMDSMSEDQANQIRRLELDGLELLPQQERLYPQENLFANIVGYVNVDRQAQAGLEYSQEDHLARALPELEISRAGDGSVLPTEPASELAQNDDLQLKLTVDSRIQRAARYALQQQTKKYGAKRGVAIVMDVNDGSILAMASEPSFDANKYYKADLETLRDWVVTDVYEPGSTFKPVNIAIALEAGVVKPTDKFFDEGKIQIGEWPIQNADYESVGTRGTISLSEILEYSSNVGMVHVMQRLSPGLFYGWLEKLKLAEITGIDLPFEVPGQVKKYSEFTSVRVEPATTAFGQGFSLTPIKLIQLHATLANGGNLVTPHVVQGLVDSKGQLKWQPDHAKPKQVFSDTTTKAVLKMMEQVVDRGTGQAALIPGFRIAGKTGTAQKASQYGGYSRARITSFIGILPVDAPRYAVLAVVDEPQGDDAYGATVAAPIVKEVMEALIASERIPPTQPDQVGRDEVSALPTIREAVDFRHQINPNEPHLIEPTQPGAPIQPAPPTAPVASEPSFPDSTEAASPDPQPADPVQVANETGEAAEPSITPPADEAFSY